MQSRSQTDIFGTYSTSFWKVGFFLSMRSPITFQKVCMKIIKTIAYNTKRRRPRFPKKSKAVFISIRYRKTSQTQDVRSQSTELSVRKIAQPKHDSAFEQKTRIGSCRHITPSSQNSFFLQPKNQAEQSSKRLFWNVLNVILESFCFAQETKAVFVSIRYPKTSQTQDVKSQKTKRSLQELAQPKRDSLFEKRHVLFQVERSQERLKTIFVFTAKKSKAELKETFMERTQRRFGQFLFSLRWNRPKFFGSCGRKSSKQLHTIQNDEDHVSQKNQKLFL